MIMYDEILIGSRAGGYDTPNSDLDIVYLYEEGNVLYYNKCKRVDSHHISKKVIEAYIKNGIFINSLDVALGAWFTKSQKDFTQMFQRINLKLMSESLKKAGSIINSEEFQTDETIIYLPLLIHGMKNPNFLDRIGRMVKSNVYTKYVEDLELKSVKTLDAIEKKDFQLKCYNYKSTVLDAYLWKAKRFKHHLSKGNFGMLKATKEEAVGLVSIREKVNNCVQIEENGKPFVKFNLEALV